MPTQSPEGLLRKAEGIDSRLRARLSRLDQQAVMSAKPPPRITTAAVVLPLSQASHPWAGAPH